MLGEQPRDRFRFHTGCLPTDHLVDNHHYHRQVINSEYQLQNLAIVGHKHYLRVLKNSLKHHIRLLKSNELQEIR